jgi:hypothetical protein
MVDEITINFSEEYAEEHNKTEAGEIKSDTKEDLVTRFERERKEWTVKVESMTGGIKDIYDCANTLTTLLSNRQIALEYTHMLMSLLSKINAQLREKRKERYIYYTQSYDLKLDKEPKNMFIDDDLRKSVLLQELFQNHLGYMRGTIDTMDKIHYSIKWRIQLEEYKRSQH